MPCPTIFWCQDLILTPAVVGQGSFLYIRYTKNLFDGKRKSLLPKSRFFGGKITSPHLRLEPLQTLI